MVLLSWTPRGGEAHQSALLSLLSPLSLSLYLSSLLSNSADPASAAALPAHASPADPAGSVGPRRSSSSPGVFGSPSRRGDGGPFPSFPPFPFPCSPPRRELPRRCRAERWPPASPAPSAPGRRARSCGGLPCTRPRSYGGWRGEAPWGPPLPHPSATSSGGLHEAEPARGGIGQASRARADGAARSLAWVAATLSCSSRRGRKELPRSARGRSRGRSAGEQGRVRVADAPLRPASVRRTRAAWRAGRGARGGRDPCSPSSSGAGHRGGQPTKASRAAALKLRSRPDPGAPPPPPSHGGSGPDGGKRARARAGLRRRRWPWPAPSTRWRRSARRAGAAGGRAVPRPCSLLLPLPLSGSSAAAASGPPLVSAPVCPAPLARSPAWAAELELMRACRRGWRSSGRLPGWRSSGRLPGRRGWRSSGARADGDRREER